MADIKISQLPASGGLVGDELVPIVTDPSGTPVTESISVQDIANLAPGTEVQTIVSKTAGSTTLLSSNLSTANSVKFIRVQSNASGQTITLPAVGAGDVGKWFNIYNRGTNKMTLTSSSSIQGDSVVVAASSACVAYVTANGEYTVIGTGNTVKFIQMEIAAPADSISTGDNKRHFRIPAEFGGWEIVDVHAEVATAGAGGVTQIQIRNVYGGADVLSTKLSIDDGETGSDTAATPAVINTSFDEVAANDVISVDIDAVPATAPLGLIVTIEIEPK